MNSRDTYLLTTYQFYTTLYVDLEWILFNECIPLLSLLSFSSRDSHCLSVYMRLSVWPCLSLFPSLCLFFLSCYQRLSLYLYHSVSLTLFSLSLPRISPHYLSLPVILRGCQSVSSVCLSFSSLSLRISPNLSQSVCVAMSVCFCPPLCMSVSLSRFLNN